MADRLARGDFGMEDALEWEQSRNDPFAAAPPNDEDDADDWPEISEADYAYLTAPRERPSPCPWCGGRLVHHPACDELRLSWQVVMPFGKHEGKRLSEIPRDYLEWLANVATVDDDLKTAAKRQLEDPDEE